MGGCNGYKAWAGATVARHGRARWLQTDGAMDTRHGRAQWLQTDSEALRTEHYEPVKTLSHYLALVYMHSGHNGYKGGPLARCKGGALVGENFTAIFPAKCYEASITNQ